MVRKCQGCGVENPDYSVYCGVCGKELVVFKDTAEKPGTVSGIGGVCEKCGTALPESGVCTFCAQIDEFKREPQPDRDDILRRRPGITPIGVVGATIMAIGVLSFISAIKWGAFVLFLDSWGPYVPEFVEALSIVACIGLALMGAIAVIGGYSAMMLGVYRIAVVGAVFAAIIGFLMGGVIFVVGVVCVILVMMSKDDF